MVNLKPNMMVEVRVDGNGEIKVGFANEHGGVYVDMDTVPEMLFERAMEYCEFVKNQPDTYKEFCEYWGLDAEKIDENVDFFVQKKAVKDVIKKMKLFENELKVVKE